MSTATSRLGGLVAAASTLSRRDWLVFVGAAGVLSIGVIAVFAPILAPYPADVAVGDPFEAPSSAHPLGTDDAGHDLLSLLLVGARVSLLVGLLAGSLAVLAGLLVGVTAGVVGGRTETVLMRVVDVVLTLPFLPLVIVAAAVLGPSLATTVGVLVAVMWARPARELRSQVLSIRERTFVRASRSMGASPTYVARHYVVPALLPIAVAQFAKAASSAILLEASLSFLGLGDPTAPSWGTILFYAQQRSAFLTDAWSWWVLPPGVAIGGSVLSFTFLALGIERRTAGDRRAATAVDDGPELTVMPPAPDSAPVLDVTDLTVVYGDDDTAPTAVDDVNLSVGRGETLGVVGESGSGKSSLALALLALLDPPGRVASGSVTLRTDRIDDAGAARSPTMADFRGDAVAFVPQEAMNALDPRRTLREQVVEAVVAHRDCSRERAEDVLTDVGLDAESHGRYPHELSGGMRQRGVIAAALANDPDVLVADEPTTGLDTVTTIRLLDLLESLQARLGFSLVMVTHDLSSVARVADRIAVVRDGRVVEVGETDRLHESPDHPYTNELLGARPTLPSDIGASRGASGDSTAPTDSGSADTGDAHLEYDGVAKSYDGDAVLRGVHLRVSRGESVALVGESGAGKSTLGRMAAGLVTPDEGTVAVEGRSVPSWAATDRTSLGRTVHYLFQDPYASLSPNRTVGCAVREPLDIHDIGEPGDRDARVLDALSDVGLAPAEDYAGRRPTALSGGERQRVAIARAVVLEPAVLVADEPTSMLDAPLRRDLLELLYDLVAARDITLLHVTHDIAAASEFADRLAVLAAGRIVESGPPATLLSTPSHEETRTLVDATRALHAGRSPTAADANAADDIAENAPAEGDEPHAER
ncbi:ATP-binding cassette domain-containing protein [Haloferax sp. AS1]|uniref:ATP-binding cassette domain-containing protein n=1 Tax=Haloferax sp. AS1 TaxID=2562277 RepID=UPI00165F5514|nr:ATP-binding cassette domain-containing protein [Haloferax sp. AS1]